MPSAAMREVEAFFRAYAAAFEAKDLTAITALWAYPAQVVTDAGDGVHRVVMPSAEAFQGPLEQVFELYRRVGCKRIRVDALQVDELSGALRRGTVRWALHGLADLPLYAFTTSYVLARLDGQWRAVSAVSHDELAQYRRFIGR
jgi:hypothetical protein